MSLRVIVRTASELCVTVDTLIVLFVVCVLFWTGVKADTEMDHQVDLLRDRWASWIPHSLWSQGNRRHYAVSLVAVRRYSCAVA